MPEMTFAAVDIPDVTALREAVIPPRMPYNSFEKLLSFQPTWRGHQVRRYS